MAASSHSSTLCESARNVVNPSSSKSSDSLQKMMHFTRGASQLFGLESAICREDAVITGCRLPTCLQVLRCMMCHCNLITNKKRPGALGTTSHYTAAKLVMQQVSTFDEKANIPMVTECRTCEKIVQLLNANNKLRFIPKQLRNTLSTQKKLSSFMLRMPSSHRQGCDFTHL